MTSKAIELRASVIEDYYEKNFPHLAGDATTFAALVENRANVLYDHIITLDVFNNLVHLVRQRGGTNSWSDQRVPIDAYKNFYKIVSKIVTLINGGTISVLLQYADTRACAIMEWDFVRGWRKAVLDSSVQMLGGVNAISSFRTSPPTTSDFFSWTSYFYGQYVSHELTLTTGDEPKIAGSKPADHLFILKRDGTSGAWSAILDQDVATTGDPSDRYVLANWNYGGSTPDAVSIMSFRSDFSIGAGLFDTKSGVLTKVTDRRFSIDPDYRSQNGFSIRDSRGMSMNGLTDAALINTNCGFFSCFPGSSSNTPAPEAIDTSYIMPADINGEVFGIAALSQDIDKSTEKAYYYGVGSKNNILYCAEMAQGWLDWKNTNCIANATAALHRGLRDTTTVMLSKDMKVFELTHATQGGITAQQSTFAQRATKIEYQPSLSIVAKVCDENGVALQGVNVLVTASRPLTALHHATPHLLSSEAIELRTDHQGTITLKIPARSMTFPKIVFELPGSQPAVRNSCTGDVVETQHGGTKVLNLYNVTPRLAGFDPQFTVDVATMKKVGLMDANTQNGDAIVSSIKVLACQALCQQGYDTAKIRAIDCFRENWKLSVAAGSPSAFSQVSQSQADQITGRASDALVSGGGTIKRDLFDDINPLPFLKTTASKLLDLVENVPSAATVYGFLKDGPAKGFILVVETVASGLKKYVIDSVDSGQAAIEFLFSIGRKGVQKAEEYVQKGIDWLAQLLSYKDISNTAYVFEEVFNRAFDNVATLISIFEKKVDDKIDSVAKTATDSLDGLIAFLGTKTINQLGNEKAPPSKPGTNSLENPQYKILADQNYNRNHHISNRVQDHLIKNAPFLVAAPGLEVPRQHQNLVTDLKSAAKKILGIISSPDKIFDVVLVDMLELFKEMISLLASGVKSVVNFILDSMRSAITHIKEFLNRPIEIPFLTDILTGVLGIPQLPSLLRILCLCVAAPATIMYKLVNDGRAPFADGDLTKVRQALDGLIRSESSSASSPSGPIHQQGQVPGSDQQLNSALTGRRNEFQNVTVQQQTKPQKTYVNPIFDVIAVLGGFSLVVSGPLSVAATALAVQELREGGTTPGASQGSTAEGASSSEGSSGEGSSGGELPTASPVFLFEGTTILSAIVAVTGTLSTLLTAPWFLAGKLSSDGWAKFSTADWCVLGLYGTQIIPCSYDLLMVWSAKVKALARFNELAMVLDVLAGSVAAIFGGLALWKSWSLGPEDYLVWDKIAMPCQWQRLLIASGWDEDPYTEGVTMGITVVGSAAMVVANTLCLVIGAMERDKTVNADLYRSSLQGSMA